MSALSQSLLLKAGLDIPEVHVGKVVGFFFLMLKMVYYTILVLGVASVLSIVLGLLLIVLPVPILLFGIVAIFCPLDVSIKLCALSCPDFGG